MCRSPVFSHDELVCKMMAQPDRLELCLLLTTRQDSAYMIQLEKRVLSELKNKVIALPPASVERVRAVDPDPQSLITITSNRKFATCSIH